MQVGYLDLKTWPKTMTTIAYGQSGCKVGRYGIFESCFVSKNVLFKLDNPLILFLDTGSKYVEIKKCEPIYQIFDVN